MGLRCSRVNPTWSRILRDLGRHPSQGLGLPSFCIRVGIASRSTCNQEHLTQLPPRKERHREWTHGSVYVLFSENPVDDPTFSGAAVLQKRGLRSLDFVFICGSTASHISLLCVERVKIQKGNSSRGARELV